MSDRLFKCRRLVGTVRCTFDGNAGEADVHELESGHGRCVCCRRFLGDVETRVCEKCVTRTRQAIADTAEAVTLAPEVIEGNGYRGILWDLLTAISDGTIESPVQQQHPEQYVYKNSKGRDVPLEETTDPWPVVAVLFGIEQCWRDHFEHGPRMTDATVSSCANYLTFWLPAAAGTWPGFDDDATTIRTLASRLKHMTGTADIPMRGVGCLDRLDADSRCDGTLVRTYRDPAAAIPAQGRAGKPREGLDDAWACDRCKRVYDQGSYYLAVKAALEDEIKETA